MIEDWYVEMGSDSETTLNPCGSIALSFNRYPLVCKQLLRGIDIFGVLEVLLGLKGTLEYIPIEKVIHNGPATIVLFANGDKSVVKCEEGTEYNELAGFTLAVLKYYFGSAKLQDMMAARHDD